MYIYIYIYQSILINQSINQSNSSLYLIYLVRDRLHSEKNRDAMDAANHAQAHVGPCPARAMRTVRTGAGAEGAPGQWP